LVAKLVGLKGLRLVDLTEDCSVVHLVEKMVHLMVVWKVELLVE
jgi:hypothetical protein